MHPRPMGGAPPVGTSILMECGVLGFSAGGYLVAEISTRYGHRLYTPVDAADKVSCRPDFAVVVYPGHLWAGGRGYVLNPNCGCLVVALFGQRRGPSRLLKTRLSLHDREQRARGAPREALPRMPDRCRPHYVPVQHRGPGAVLDVNAVRGLQRHQLL